MPLIAPDPKIRVAVLGATGSVGQRFVSLLLDHPWFQIGGLTASDRSAGRSYGELVEWRQDRALPAAVAQMPVLPSRPDAVADCPLAFSALDSSVAEAVERAFAADGRLLVSNTRAHRMHPRVPLVIPEVNAEHLELAHAQAFGGGRILTNPNCSTIGLVLALKALDDAFGLDAVHVTTMQALSGAGNRGTPGMEDGDNVVPFIAGEEEKMESESCKILGRLHDGEIENRALRISAQCNRVAVADGHTACVSVSFHRPAGLEEIRAVWEEFRGEPQRLALPSAPRIPVHVLTDESAPQPRRHRDLEGGMAVSVGRVRPCHVLDVRFVTLSHNTIRGAAGGALLVAELAIARGLLPGVSLD